MSITILYTGALALVLLVLSIRVIQGRGSQGVFLGDGGDALMMRRMRAQANFVEYVPMILIMMAFLESMSLVAWAVHAMGASLLLARVLHMYAMAFSEHFRFGRFWGTVITFTNLLVGGVLCLIFGFQAM